MSYLIKTVASMTGIPKNTLIAWERRHGVVEPDRSDSGYRYYSEDDVRTLLRLKELIAAGYRISEAAEMVKREPLPQIDQVAVSMAEGEGLDALRDATRACLLVFDRAGADRLAQQLTGLSFEDRLHAVFLPILREIGDGWERGDVTIAQEHFASEWLREQMFAMMRALGAGRPDAPEAVCATPSGDRHEFGLLSVAIRLSLRGWQVTYLGADVPAADVAQVVAQRRPTLVAVSMVLERPPQLVHEWLDELAARIGPATRVVVGGRAAVHLDRAALPGSVSVSTSVDELGPRAAERARESA